MNNADLILLDEHDQRVRLGSLWQKRPVLLFFMRHLGCALCRKQLMSLRDHAAAFEAAGCDVAIIMMGGGEQAHGLSRMVALPFPVYGDPSQKVYEAFELGEASLWTVAGPHVLLRQMQLALKGIPIGNGPGSLRRLGGMAVLDQRGTILYHYVANPIHRYPPWSEVLAAVNGAGNPLVGGGALAAA